MVSRLFPINVCGGLSAALWLISFELLLVCVVTGQQVAGKDSWQTYSPAGSSFSMRIPGIALPAQGHIFDPAYEKRAHRLIKHASQSRIYNFEIEKGGQRQFLVSILEAQITKRRSDRFITDSEVRLINATIGDDIAHSKVDRVATEDGAVSQWSYTRKGGLGEDDEDDGVVYAQRRGPRMVIVIVDYDYAEGGDTEVKAMLESLRLR